MRSEKYIVSGMVATLLVVVAHTSLAETSYYIGGNVAAMDTSVGDEVDDDLDEIVGLADDLSLAVAYGKFGVQFHENFSAEFRAGVGIKDDTTVYGVADSRTLELLEIGEIDIDISNFVGLYLRSGVRAGERFYPYLILGYTRIKLKGKAEGYESGDDSYSDFSYGVGADIDFSETVSGNIEYIQYLDKDDVDIKGIAIGITKSF